MKVFFTFADDVLPLLFTISLAFKKWFTRFSFVIKADFLLLLKYKGLATSQATSFM